MSFEFHGALPTVCSKGLALISLNIINSTIGVVYMVYEPMRRTDVKDIWSSQLKLVCELNIDLRSIPREGSTRHLFSLFPETEEGYSCSTVFMSWCECGWQGESPQWPLLEQEGCQHGSSVQVLFRGACRGLCRASGLTSVQSSEHVKWFFLFHYGLLSCPSTQGCVRCVLVQLTWWLGENTRNVNPLTVRSHVTSAEILVVPP